MSTPSLRRSPRPPVPMQRGVQQPWWQLGILERYVVVEIVPNLLAGVVLVVLLLLMQALFGKAGEIIAKGANPLLVLQLIAFSIPQALSQGLPIALLFAALMGLTRMTQDAELKAAITHGFSPRRLAVPVLMVGGLTGLVTFINQEALQPRATEEQLRVYKDITLSNPRVLVQAGRFLADKQQQQTIYVQPNGIKDGGALEGVTIIQGQINQVPGAAIVAPKGQILVQEGAIRLENGVRVSYRASDGRKVTVARFRQATVPIKDLQQGSGLALEPTNMSTVTLLGRIKEFQMQGIRTSNEELALWRKFADPAATLAFALFAVAMAMFSLRSNQNFGFVGVVFLTFFYYATWMVCKPLGEQGILPPFLAAWAPDLIYTLAAGALFWFANRR